jgi:hypothetical protein
MIPKVQAVRRDPSSLTVQVIYSDQTIETYMDGFNRLFEIKIGLTKSQVHQIVNLSKTTIKTGTASGIDDDDLNAKYRRAYLGDWETEIAGNSSSKTSGGSVFVGAPFDPQTFDPLRARVGAGAYMNSPWATVTVPDFSANASQQISGVKSFNSTLGSAQAHTSAPWDDPLAAQTNDNIVACMDIPEWKPECKPNNYILPNQIYYHDRYPTINLHSIIYGAIEVLNKHKNLHVTKIDLHTNSVDGEVSLAFSADDRKPGFRKTLEVTFPHKAFERFTHDLDRYAGLKAKWDTNTYIKMRIAYLLLHAVKLNKADAEKINLDIIRIFASNTRPTFTI